MFGLHMGSKISSARSFSNQLHRCASTISSANVVNDPIHKIKTETKTGISRRFWDKVTIDRHKESEKLIIQLDKKPIKTPLGNYLCVDKNRKLLAMLLQKEWSNMSRRSIRTHALPLTSLVARCIDLDVANRKDAHPDLKVKIGGNVDEICDSLLHYLDTDTVLVFSPRSDLEGKLRAAQDDMYLPMIDAVEKFLSHYSDRAISLQLLDADIHGLRGNSQNPETITAARKFLESLSPWDLAVFEKTVMTTKSFICGIILLQNKSVTGTAKGLQYTMEDLAKAATLETIYQTARWGEVEDTHDVDKRDIRRNINAAAIVAYRS